LNQTDLRLTKTLRHWRARIQGHVGPLQRVQQSSPANYQCRLWTHVVDSDDAPQGDSSSLAPRSIFEANQRVLWGQSIRLEYGRPELTVTYPGGFDPTLVDR